MFFEMCRCFPFRLVSSPILWGPPCFKGCFKNVLLAAIMRRCTTWKFSRKINSYSKADCKKSQLHKLSSYIVLLCTELKTLTLRSNSLNLRWLLKSFLLLVLAEIFLARVLSRYSKNQGKKREASRAFLYNCLDNKQEKWKLLIYG